MFYVGLLQYKRCCNCFNFVSCILWDLIVLDLVLSWWRIKLAMKISAISRLSRENLMNRGSREKATWEAHVGSWRIKCQDVFREYFSRKAISWGIYETLFLEDFKMTFFPFTHTIYTLITHKSKRGYSEKTLERFLQHTHLLERELLIL